MLAFGYALRAHNPFLGYEGDFDEAAASCFKTAAVFGVLAGVSFGSFVVSAVRSKMGHGTSSSAPITPGSGYQAV